MNRSNRGVRSWVAIALLGVMCLGSTFHFWHHLTDRDCDSFGRHGTVPCTSCSGLHGGVITPHADVSAPRVPSVVARLAPVDADEPATRESVEGTPRAPPTA